MRTAQGVERRADAARDLPASIVVDMAMGDEPDGGRRCRQRSDPDVGQCIHEIGGSRIPQLTDDDVRGDRAVGQREAWNGGEKLAQSRARRLSSAICGIIVRSPTRPATAIMPA